MLNDVEYKPTNTALFSKSADSKSIQVFKNHLGGGKSTGLNSFGSIECAFAIFFFAKKNLLQCFISIRSFLGATSFRASKGYEVFNSQNVVVKPRITASDIRAQLKVLLQSIATL